MTNSIQKGKRGEREVVDLLKLFGFKARRGQQFKGTPDSPDIIHDIPEHFIEVKRTERFNAYKALEQANDDADILVPVVFHRKNDKDWIVVMEAMDFLSLIKEWRMLKYGT